MEKFTEKLTCTPTVFFNNTIHDGAATTERFFCTVCGKNYLRKRHLQRHMRDECIGIPPRFECELCPSKFRRKYHLVRHMSARHGIITPMGGNASGGGIASSSATSTSVASGSGGSGSSGLHDIAASGSSGTLDTNQLNAQNKNPIVKTENVEGNNVMNNFSVDAIMMKNDNLEDVLSPKFKVFDELRQKLGLRFSPETLLKYRQIKY